MASEATRERIGRKAGTRREKQADGAGKGNAGFSLPLSTKHSTQSKGKLLQSLNAMESPSLAFPFLLSSICLPTRSRYCLFSPSKKERPLIGKSLSFLSPIPFLWQTTQWQRRQAGKQAMEKEKRESHRLTSTAIDLHWGEWRLLSSHKRGKCALLPFPYLYLSWRNFFTLILSFFIALSSLLFFQTALPSFLRKSFQMCAISNEQCIVSFRPLIIIVIIFIICCVDWLIIIFEWSTIVAVLWWQQTHHLVSMSLLVVIPFCKVRICLWVWNCC